MESLFLTFEQQSFVKHNSLVKINKEWREAAEMIMQRWLQWCRYVKKDTKKLKKRLSTQMDWKLHPWGLTTTHPQIFKNNTEIAQK